MRDDNEDETEERTYDTRERVENTLQQSVLISSFHYGPSLGLGDRVDSLGAVHMKVPYPKFS